jgi:hypothetical protein
MAAVGRREQRRVVVTDGSGEVASGPLELALLVEGRPDDPLVQAQCEPRRIDDLGALDDPQGGSMRRRRPSGVAARCRGRASANANHVDILSDSSQFGRNG